MTNRVNSITNRRFPGAEDLDDIDLRNLVNSSENYLGSGAFGDVYYVKDTNGKENKDYAVKVIRKQNFVFTKTLRAVFGNNFPIVKSIDEEFRKEVKTLYNLKSQGIGPEIVYANYTKNYYVIERMDRTLNSILSENVLTPKHALMFLALIDRYLMCEYYHDDFHLNNIMWSEKLGDFRMIDWGIGLRIGEMPEEKKKWWINDRIKGLFDGGTFWVLMVYIKDCLDTESDETQKAKWKSITEKYSKWMSSNLKPDDAEKYNIFSDKFTRQKEVNETLKIIKRFRIKKTQKQSKSKISSGRLRKMKSSKKK